MSRAFVNEDSGGRPSGRRFVLPPRTDPAFDAAAARAILEAAHKIVALHDERGTT